MPLFPYPGSPEYRRLWGLPDDSAWERTVEYYLNQHPTSSDIQEKRPLPLGALRGASRIMSSLPLTVLMTADAVGGVWSYAAGLSRSLREIRFVLAKMGPRPRRAHRDEIGRLNNVTLVESDYSLEWMTEGGADLAESCAWLVGLVNTYRVDIVHVNG